MINQPLSEKILASRYGRMASLADIKSYTSTLLSSYRENREASSLALKTELSRESRERTKFWRNRSSEIREMLQCIREDRIDSSREQQQRLESFAKGNRDGVSRFVANARSSRRKMSREMAKEHRDFILSVRKRTREIASGSRGLVAGFSRARMTLAREIEKQLVSCTQDRRVGVRLMLSGLHGQQAASVKAPPVIMGLHGASDEENTLNIILAHPEGISAMQIGEMLGIGAMQVGRIASALSGTGKIHKDEKSRRYFPAEEAPAENGESS